MKKKIFIALVLIISAIATSVALAAGNQVNRGLPTDNLNNAAGADRSNVAWSNGSDYVTGDSFTVGTTGHQYKLDSLTVWNIGHFGSPFADQFSNVKLYLAGSDGSLQVIPATLSTKPVEYANNTNYQASSGSFRQIFEDTFTNMNVTLNGGDTYYFAVDGDANDYLWFNHASNAELSGSPQEGSDGVYYAWSKEDLATPNQCDSGVPAGESVCNGGWDKSSDINVLIGVSEIITDQTFQQVDRVTACASKPVLRVADHTMGIFADLDQATFDSGQYDGATFTPSLYVAGVGATCDVPAGYHYAGHNVDASGNVDETSANNIHPLYIK